MTQEADVKAMVACAVNTYGGLHIAVNNAGVNRNSAAEDTVTLTSTLTPHAS